MFLFSTSLVLCWLSTDSVFISFFFSLFLDESRAFLFQFPRALFHAEPQLTERLEEASWILKSLMYKA